MNDDLSKKDIFILIENEEQLEEVEKILKFYNQPIFEKWFNIDGDFCHLFFDGANWWIGYIPQRKNITISELETILKKESK